MQLIIEIPDEEYTWILKSDETVFADVASKECMLHAIKNGVQLPTGHGRLKDVDAFLQKVREDRAHAAYIGSWDANDVLEALDTTYAPTVVEAEFPLTDTERAFLAKVQNDVNRAHRLADSKKAYGKHVGE